MSKLKEFRNLHHLSQSKVAQECKISLRMYQYYEADLKIPTVYIAIRLAQVLQTTVEELFPGEPPAPIYDDN